MSLHVSGLSTAIPRHTLPQADALDMAGAVLGTETEKTRLLQALFRRSGVKQRHICVPYQYGLKWAKDQLPETSPGESSSRGPTTRERMQLYEEHAPALALSAADAALTAANVAPEEITHVVTVSCTGFTAPGLDAALIERLALSPGTERVHVGFMGCHGGINGLRVASGLAALAGNHRVLLCAVELCSLHYFFDWEPDKLVSNALFADGAAALVASSRPGGGSSWQVLATGSFVFPDTTDAMSWRLGDHGFEMTLAPSVPALIAGSLRQWLTAWLDRHGVGLSEIDHWAVHPGGPRIVSAVAESLDLASAATEASRETLAAFGNMSSPTIFFIIDRLRQQAATGLCVALAFGPGLVAEAALLKLE